MAESGGSHPPANPPETTVALLERIRGGDARAREDLYRRFAPALRAWARGRLPAAARDRLDTDDLVQISLARSLERLREFEPRRDGAFLAYLRRILINVIRDEVRRVSRLPGREDLTEALPDGGPTPLDRALGRDLLDRYEEALEKLPEEDREAVILRVELGFSYPEVARAIGSPSPNAARMRIVRALMALAEVLDAG